LIFIFFVLDFFLRAVWANMWSPAQAQRVPHRPSILLCFATL